MRWFTWSLLAGILAACSSPSEKTPGVAEPAAGAGGEGATAAEGGAASTPTGCSSSEQPCDACGLSCNNDGCREGVCILQPLYQPPKPTNAIDMTIGVDHLFWTDASGDVLRSSLEGDSPTVIDSHGDRTLGLTADDSNVYWLQQTQGTLTEADRDGEGAAVLATFEGTPFELVVADAKQLFVVLSDSGEIWSVERSDGQTALVATSSPGAAFLAADADYLAWTDVMGGKVSMMTRASGEVSVAAANQKQPQGIAIRDGTLYWTDAGAAGMA